MLMKMDTFFNILLHHEDCMSSTCKPSVSFCNDFEKS